MGHLAVVGDHGKPILGGQLTGEVGDAALGRLELRAVHRTGAVNDHRDPQRLTTPIGRRRRSGELHQQIQMRFGLHRNRILLQLQRHIHDIPVDLGGQRQTAASRAQRRDVRPGWP